MRERHGRSVVFRRSLLLDHKGEGERSRRWRHQLGLVNLLARRCPLAPNTRRGSRLLELREVDLAKPCRPRLGILFFLDILRFGLPRPLRRLEPIVRILELMQPLFLPRPRLPDLLLIIRKAMPEIASDPAQVLLLGLDVLRDNSTSQKVRSEEHKSVGWARNSTTAALGSTCLTSGGKARACTLVDGVTGLEWRG